jgi:hypothetical protein
MNDCTTSPSAAPTTATRVVLIPTTFDRRRGQRYSVELDGVVIVEDAIDPEYTACRALVARGITGRLEVWRAGATYASMVIRDIEKGARLTVREDARRGPCVVPYRPLPKKITTGAVDDEAPIQMALSWVSGAP